MEGGDMEAEGVWPLWSVVREEAGEEMGEL